MSIERDNELRSIYGSSASIPNSLIPTRIDEFTPFITDKEIDAGEVTRYFARSANNSSPGEIIEVSPQVFTKLQTNNFYTLVSIRWLIRGPVDTTIGLTDTNEPVILQYGVSDANKKAVEIGYKQMPGLAKVVTNFMRFYQGL